MTDAVKAAQRYIEAAIRTAPGLGRGNGPLNHFHSTYTMPFARYVIPMWDTGLSQTNTA